MVIDRHYSRHYSRRKRLAVLGELRAAEYLENWGYTIIAQNWRAGRWGEIDIIAEDPDGTLVFVEVKTRSAYSPGSGIYLLGFEAINLEKQRKIIRSAWRFLQTIERRDSLRFDAMVIIYPENYSCYDREINSSEPQIIHVPNAFAPD